MRSLPRILRRTDGQTTPLLLFVGVAVVAVGFALFLIGRADTARAGAQSAADAAALAAAKVLGGDVAGADAGLTADRLSRSKARDAAADYAKRNGAELVFFEVVDFDVRVRVRSVNERTEMPDGRPVYPEARARAGVRSQEVSGDGHVEDVPPAPGGDTVFDAIVREATRIDALHSTYLYGGGHSTPAPATPPWDCSSSVSRVLQASGFDVPTSASGDMMNWFDPGPGRVSILASPGHVYMVIDGHAWGTSPSNPGGGPGFISEYTYQQGFAVRHIPEAMLRRKFDASKIKLGAIQTSNPLGLTFQERLVPWDGGDEGVPGFTGTGAATPVTASRLQIARMIYAVGRRMHVSDKVMLSAFETALVESDMQNLSYGDRDSLGVFQQRPSMGWGSPAQVMNVPHAAQTYFSRAKPAERGGQTAGQLAQSVQRSAFPERYDQRQGEARQWLARVEGSR
jgi:Putative Flp pilus-assembly TadE/G-like